MKSTRQFTAKHQAVVSTLASLLVYLVARLTVVPLLGVLMASPPPSVGGEVNPARIELIFTHHELLVRTAPYLLAGVMVRLLTRGPGILLVLVALLAASHWYEPVRYGGPHARLAFDYVRLSTYALGVLGASGAIVVRDWLLCQAAHRSSASPGA